MGSWYKVKCFVFLTTLKLKSQDFYYRLLNLENSFQKLMLLEFLRTQKFKLQILILVRSCQAEKCLTYY